MLKWNWLVFVGMVVMAMMSTVSLAETTPQTHDEFVAVAKKAQDNGDHKLAIELYDKAIRMRGNSTQARYGKIISYEALGDYKTIIKTASEIIKIDAADINAYYIRGISYIHLQPYKTSNYKMAYKDLSYVIEKRPDYDEAWIDRGLSWAGQEKFDKAIEDINQAIKIKETGRAYRARATVYRLQNKEDLAQADEKKAFQLGG